MIQATGSWFHENDGISYSRNVATWQGDIVLQRFCTAPFIESLKVDSGLCAFARLPKREHELLAHVARQPECMLTIAYNKKDEIVGELTLAPVDAWWHTVRQRVCMYEIGLEVSHHWRRLGLARQLLSFALDLTRLEDCILLGMGLVWHWDTARTGVPPLLYRKLIAQTLAPYGFEEYLTMEPNIASEPANILLARIGRRVDVTNVNEFIHCSLRAERLL
jgi:acetoin utilization protein AcuA